MVPVKPFSEMNSSPKITRLPNSSGRGPVNWFAAVIENGVSDLVQIYGLFEAPQEKFTISTYSVREKQEAIGQALLELYQSSHAWILLHFLHT